MTAHYPGQFKECRKQMGEEKPENEKRNCVHFLEMEETAKKEMEITDVFTHSDYRGVRVAGLALDQIKKIALEQNIQALFGTITYYSDPKDRAKLRGFYRKYGFTVTNNENSRNNDTFRLELNSERAPAFDLALTTNHIAPKRQSPATIGQACNSINILRS